MEEFVSAPLARKTKSLVAADEIRRRILDNHYEAGSQLKQDILDAELGMSRIPIREALVLLEAEGVVRILPHRGAVVTKPSREEIEELFNIRMLLEPFLLLRTAPHLTAEDFAFIEEVLDEYRMSLIAADAKLWNDLNSKFHLALYRRANSPRALASVATLLQECDRHTRLQLANIADGPERAVREHEELIRLCRLRAFGAAAEMMRAHIGQIGSDLDSLLR